MKGHWNHFLLGTLLVGHLVLLSAQDAARGSLAERWVLSVLGPVLHGTRSSADMLAGLGEGLQTARSLREENRQLRDEVAAMRRRLVELHGVEEELEQLSLLSEYQRFDVGSFFVADVVYLDHGSWLRTLVIHTGSDDTRVNQPVVNDLGLVGRIIRPARGYAKVLLLTDRSASVSAMIQRTRRRGIAHGSGAETLQLDNIPLLEDVRVGDEVVTAGIDGIFPRGLPIGRVRSVESSQGLFHKIEVETAIDLGLLDQVYVLTAEVVPEEVWDELYAPR